jgi:hypothetical protein
LTISDLGTFSREEIGQMIDERLAYVMSKVKILETHFVSGISGSSDRTQASPRKDEFNVIAIDIFLRHSEHKFLYANPRLLDSSGDDANHLQQNYIMGFIFTQLDGSTQLDLTDDWFENLEDVFESLSIDEAVQVEDMQIDHRGFSAGN